MDFEKILPKINIRIPTTAIIGADEFTNFIQRNDLYNKIYLEKQFDKAKDLFLKASFSEKLKNKLRKYIEVIKEPLAVRSSGLFEDSLLQPFAGVYCTYMLPNNDPDERFV